MSSVLRSIHFMFHVAPITTDRKFFPELKLISRLQVVKGREQSPLKGIIRRYISTYQKHLFRHSELAGNSARKLRADDQTQDDEDRTQNSGYGNCSNNNGGNGNGNGNDNNENGSEGDHGDDKDKECNQDELPGIEWWWWWKWRQASSTAQDGATRSNLWPVDSAIKAAASEVMHKIEPSLQAFVLKPIRLHLNTQGFILVGLLFVAFLVACIHIVAGVAVLSMGVSLAGVAVVAFALVWRAKKRGSHSQHDSKNP